MIPTLMFIPSTALKVPLMAPTPTAKGSDVAQAATPMAATPMMIPASADSRGLVQIPQEWLSSSGDKPAIFAGYYSLLPPGATGEDQADGAPRYIPIALPSGANVTLASLPNGASLLPTQTTTTTSSTTSSTKSKTKSKLKKNKKDKDKKKKAKEMQKTSKASKLKKLETKAKASTKDRPFTMTSVTPASATTATTIGSTTPATIINTGESVRRRDIFWEDMFAQLKAFKEVHGHCMVPQKHPHLGGWVKRQRERRKKRRLNESRIAALDEIGFIWQIRGHAKGDGSDDEDEDDEEEDDDDDEEESAARKQSMKTSLDELASTAARALSKNPKKSDSDAGRSKKEKKSGGSKKRDRSVSPKRKSKTSNDAIKVPKLNTPALLVAPRVPVVGSTMTAAPTATALQRSTPNKQSPLTTTITTTTLGKQTPNMRFDDIKRYSTTGSRSPSLPSSTSPSPSAQMPPILNRDISPTQQLPPSRALQLPLPHEPSNLRLQAQLFSQSPGPTLNDVTTNEPTNPFEYPPLSEGKLYTSIVVMHNTRRLTFIRFVHFLY
eukprot:TRINITY_DN2768_c0_g1_i1.p1 TRINITY_DN2768_c0_g1~~TRINITY_DN2768_c0_g1_i1.p1  ORF type:complete len:551 (-),score=116.37 TRINITY_DN2768_c0_g1_i1:391-2043(-)